jgi:hypothetical protein
LDPLFAYSMPPDVQVVDSLRVIALPHINGDVSEILGNEVEEFFDYLEQHGGTATPLKLLRSSPLFRIPQKIEGMVGSDQPAVNKGSTVFYRIARRKRPRSGERMRELL